MRDFDKTVLVTWKIFNRLRLKHCVKSKCKPTRFCPLSEHQRIDVQKWESGAKRPGGMSLKLLSIVQKHGLDVL
jgi:putative transcriptional regulator